MSNHITISLPDVRNDRAESICRIIHERVPSEFVTIDTFPTEPKSTEEWIERIKGADGIMLGWKLPLEAMNASPRLQAVSFLGTGIADQISLPTCEAQGISTYVVSGYGDNAVAEHTMALLYSVWNQVPQLNNEVHSGRWQSVGRAELLGSTIGIIGYGGIGRRVAELADAMGMRVLVWSRSLEPDSALPHGTVAALDEVIIESDVISLHLALCSETIHFINANTFAQMKPGVVFINTARADLVDTDALVAALHSGHVSGTGIDVFTAEPISANHPLLGIPQAVLTPHIAYNTKNAVSALLELATLNLIRHFWPDRA